MFTTAFLNEYLHMKRIDSNRLSVLIKNQILDLLNSDSPDRVVEEIAYMEGLGHSSTKPEKEFKREPLKGFWHKHYGSSRFMGKNLENHWELQDKSESKKFVEMALETSKPYGQDGFLPTIDRPEELRRFTADLAQNFITGLKERECAKQLTGEWIVFAKHEGANYYLTVAHHREGNKDIFQRIELCKTEYPFLFRQ